MLWWLAVATALAGDGPWTLGPREDNLFLGVDYYQYSLFEGGSGGELQVPSALTATALTGVWTTGLRHGVEAELKIPFERVRAQDPEGCEAIAPVQGWCRTSAGIGDLGAQLKVRLLDELYGPPFTVSASAGLRSGEAYADRRGRLTTLGDGQTDVGGGLSLGRTDVLGRGWYRVGLDAWYWYRFPVEGALLKDEVTASFAGMLSVWPSFAVGPAVHGFWRLGGVDVAASDPSSPDRWATLAARQVQAGAKIGVYAVPGGPTFSLTLLRTVAARNNPTDTVVVSAGLGWFFKPKEEVQ